MSLKIALKCFFKALKDPKKGLAFVEERSLEPKTSAAEGGHLQLLSLLQKEGRLIDFLKEEIAPFSDGQIGAAVRRIHSDCSKSLEEFVTLRPLFNEPEGTSITLPQGYDTKAIKVIGKVLGAPPYKGIVRHRGWKAHKMTLPKRMNESDLSIVFPAEIEIIAD